MYKQIVKILKKIKVAIAYNVKYIMLMHINHKVKSKKILKSLKTFITIIDY